jgi:hypothetical protein
MTGHGKEYKRRDRNTGLSHTIANVQTPRFWANINTDIMFSLGSIKAKAKLLIFNSCYGGRFAQSQWLENHVAISASEPGKIAWDDFLGNLFQYLTPNRNPSLQERFDYGMADEPLPEVIPRTSIGHAFDLSCRSSLAIAERDTKPFIRGDLEPDNLFLDGKLESPKSPQTTKGRLTMIPHTLL